MFSRGVFYIHGLSLHNFKVNGKAPSGTLPLAQCIGWIKSNLFRIQLWTFSVHSGANSQPGLQMATYRCEEATCFQWSNSCFLFISSILSLRNVTWRLWFKSCHDWQALYNSRPIISQTNESVDLFLTLLPYNVSPILKYIEWPSCYCPTAL